ncbi:MAG: ATP-binding protein [Candidatus Staskawiczbacteria bacterium]|nr:ATP-binding protein [Candidatus Staskawiczbacteria bacterium]
MDHKIVILHFCDRQRNYMRNTFIGREKELSELAPFLKKQTASLIVVKGRRRIGKSRIIAEFAKKQKFYKFSGLPPEKNKPPQKDQEDQRKEFVRLLAEQGIPGVSSNDWGDIFWQLSQHTQKGRIIILFDEISWMAANDELFLKKLKNAWDLHFQNNRELILILCGSISSWIDENILSSTGYFGRISWTLTLRELKLFECNQFLEALNFRGSVYEKFKILAITGGVPWYLEQMRGDINADENIRVQCFTEGGVLYNEFDTIFNELFKKRSEVYKKIILALVNGPLEFADIYKKIGYEKSGKISTYLKDLSSAGFIQSECSWHIKSGKEAALCRYRLSDNYLRFYLKYICPNRHKIEKGQFDLSIDNFTGWSSALGFQFENLVLNNRRNIQNILGIKSDDIVSDSPYFQHKTTKQLGCQIDYLIQTKYNTLFVCEIKFSRHEINSSIIEEMKAKIKKLVLPKGFACFPVLIHINGVAESVEESGYFIKIIDFSELLKAE